MTLVTHDTRDNMTIMTMADFWMKSLIFSFLFVSLPSEMSKNMVKRMKQKNGNFTDVCCLYGYSETSARG